jgi:DNA-binding response OmpR family regulator
MKNNKHVVLCIDDDQDFLDSLRTIIEGAGYKVANASSAEEGLKTYKKLKPSMVIVDLMMEEIDSGTHFVKDIRALGATPPVYMLSSVGDSFHITADYADMGFTGMFQKPINPTLLLATLKAKLS